MKIEIDSLTKDKNKDFQIAYYKFISKETGKILLKSSIKGRTVEDISGRIKEKFKKFKLSEEKNKSELILLNESVNELNKPLEEE